MIIINLFYIFLANWLAKNVDYSFIGTKFSLDVSKYVGMCLYRCYYSTSDSNIYFSTIKNNCFSNNNESNNYVLIGYS